LKAPEVLGLGGRYPICGPTQSESTKRGETFSASSGITFNDLVRLKAVEGNHLYLSVVRWLYPEFSGGVGEIPVPRVCAVVKKYTGQRRVSWTRKGLISGTSCEPWVVRGQNPYRLLFSKQGNPA
jgi:hypothetical protein